MTREEKLKAFEMRLDGIPYETIGKKFGCSKQNVQQTLLYALNEKTRKSKKRKVEHIVYPNIRAKGKEEDNLLAFLRENGITMEYNFMNELAYQLIGEKKITKSTIKLLSEKFGLTEEEVLERG